MGHYYQEILGGAIALATVLLFVATDIEPAQKEVRPVSTAYATEQMSVNDEVVPVASATYLATESAANNDMVTF